MYRILNEKRKKKGTIKNGKKENWQKEVNFVSDREGPRRTYTYKKKTYFFQLIS